MRYVFIVFTFFSVFIHGQQSINFVELGLNEAVQRAKAENKMIFIDTYAKWCLPCKQMDIEFKNPTVIAYFNKNFINVKVNVDGKYGAEYKNEYHVVFLPSLIFTDYNGKVRTKIDNIISGNELVSIGKFINNKYGPSGSKNLTASVKTGPHSPSSKPTASSSPQQKPETKSNISNNKDEKILYVMGSDNKDLPPFVLKQEAYFRMELMDGSHSVAANNYLKTQANWSTEENMMFIFDFLNDCRSDLFNHVINNRKGYESLLGKEKVFTTLNILVNKELDRAFPRPTREEAYKLFNILNSKNADEKSDAYHLENLYSVGELQKFSRLGLDYINNYPTSNAGLTYRICDNIIQTNIDKKTLKKIRDTLLGLVTINSQNELYYFTLAKTYLKLKNKNRAVDNINAALNICNSKNIQNLEILTLYSLLEQG